MTLNTDVDQMLDKMRRGHGLKLNDPGMLDKINSMTKYPSIPTYHELDNEGVLHDKTVEFPIGQTVIGTEKVDGTNARIIFLPRDGLWLIGSRDELLAAAPDIIVNRSLGIVEALRKVADGVDWVEGSDFVVFYLEVFGDKRMPAWKQYGDGQAQYRLFDVADYTDVYADVLERDIEQIATWRDAGNQPWLNEVRLNDAATQTDIPLVPRLFTAIPQDIPTDIDAMHKFLFTHVPKTQVSDWPGNAEGIVLRSYDRSVIAKARFQNYRRTVAMRGK